MKKVLLTSIAEEFSRILVDPISRTSLVAREGELVTADDARSFRTGKHGYFDFTVGDQFYDMESTTEEYAGEQGESWHRFYLEYLKPWVEREGAKRVLEVGCGMGLGIRFLREDGFEAYGIDIPCLAKFWARAGNDPAHFLNCDGAKMPFPDGFFDAVYTLGTIEHIGTKVGHYTLEKNYWDTRLAFAKELLRVTKRGGRIMVTCPNKSFPIDIHHEPTDAATPPGKMKWRRKFFDKYGMTLHWPVGKYHLFSYGELKGTFCEINTASGIEPLPLKHYFAFKRTGSLGLLRKLKNVIVRYIENMPVALRKSPLNPFLVVEIRK